MLSEAGYQFDVVVSHILENFDPSLSAEQNAITIAFQKAKAVSNQTTGIILAADTLVALDQDLLGKPKDKEDAFRILTRLSNRSHSVITGFVVYDTVSQKYHKEAISTTVTFKKLTPSQIENYLLEKDRYMDKAGAYGYQDGAAQFVASIVGSATNIVGLPIEAVSLALKKFGIASVCSSDSA